MIYRYFSVACGAILVVLGFQVPSFVTQYEARVSAHLAEVSRSLSGFQAIADKYTGGSIDALVEKHLVSGDDAFRDEGAVLASLVARRRHLTEELAQLDTSLGGQVLYLVTQGDRDLVRENAREFTWTVNISEDAVVCGSASLIAGIALIDILRGLFRLIIAALRRQRTA